MTNLDDILRRGSCAICGAGVHLDDKEGRVACDGCGVPTDNCTCGKDVVGAEVVGAEGLEPPTPAL